MAFISPQLDHSFPRWPMIGREGMGGNPPGHLSTVAHVLDRTSAIAYRGLNLRGLNLRGLGGLWL